MRLVSRLASFVALIGTVLGWPMFSMLGLKFCIVNAKNNLIILSVIVFGLSVSLIITGVDLRAVTAWFLLSFVLFLPFRKANADLDYLKSQGMFTSLCVILIVIFIFVLVFKSNHTIFDIDKNIFTIPIAIICLIIFRVVSNNALIISIMISISVVVGSMNFLIFIILLYLGGRYFKKPASMFSIFITSFAAFLLSSLIVIYSALTFDFNNPDSIFAVASVIERGMAYLNAIDFISSSDLIFSGSFDAYDDFVDTRVHNDYLQIIIRYGFIFFTLFYFVTSLSFSRLNFTVSEVFAVSFYSSNLGLIGWFSGLFVFVFYLVVLNAISLINSLRWRSSVIQFDRKDN